MNSIAHHVTATGDVGPTGGGILCSVTLTGVGAAATVTIREGGSGGTIRLVLKAPSDDSRQSVLKGIPYVGQLHATMAGANAVAMVELG